MVFKVSNECTAHLTVMFHRPVRSFAFYDSHQDSHSYCLFRRRIIKHVVPSSDLRVSCLESEIYLYRLSFDREELGRRANYTIKLIMCRGI